MENGSYVLSHISTFLFIPAKRIANFECFGFIGLSQHSLTGDQSNTKIKICFLL